MADPPKSAVTASEMLLRIVLLGKSLWDQKDEESPEVAEEMSLFLRNLEDNIQVLNGNTVGLKNSATWALEALQQGLREAAKEAHKILGKGFFDSIWDAKRTFSEVRLLRERVATPFQASLLFVALTVEIKDKDNQDEFNDALLRLQNLLRAQTISSAPAFKDVRKKELQSLWQPVYAEIRDSEPHKIDEAIFYIKATEPQTDDTTDFFVHVLEELEKEKASRAPAPTRAAAPPPSSQTKKTPSTDSLKWYHDPITWDLMCDPVKASDGRTYDRWTFIEHGSSMTRSPFDRREDRPLKVEFDDIDVRGRLFQKFPEQEEEFRSRRREYRQKALELARKPLGGVEALSMLNHVLTWAEDDAECKAQRDAIQRRYPNLTLEKISRYKQAFTTLDTDSNGRVTLEELGVAFRTMGCYYTPAELQAVVRAAGAEAGANGTIDLPIFLAMMARQNEAVVSSNSGAPALSLEQVARYRDAFSSFDTDGDGSLTIQELGTAMRLLGNNLTQPELRALMSSADADGSGTLDFAEFITMITQAQDAPQQQEETVVTVVLTEAQVAHYTQAFRNFDSDGDGNLNAREMASAMALLGRRISVADAQLAIDAVDLDGNGTLNLVEFLIWMGRHLQQIGAEGAAVNQPHPPPPLSQEELTRYRGVFELYDRNGDGAITFREVASATRLLGYVATDDQLLEEFKEMDTDGNGTLDFQEFVTYLIRQEQDEEPQQQEQGSDAITSHPSFTREQLSAYRDKFDLLDKDRDGIISAGELGTLLRLLGKDPREEDVEDYIALYSNSNGLPGFGLGDFLDLLAQEFVEARSHLSPEQLAEWKANFRLFDRDGDGRISVQELGTVMGALGEKLTQAQLESMIREGDRDGNGTLDFEEFLNLMMATPIS